MLLLYAIQRLKITGICDSENFAPFLLSPLEPIRLKYFYRIGDEAVYIYHDEFIPSVLKAPRRCDMQDTSWVGFRWSKFSSYYWVKFYRGKKFPKEVVYRTTGERVILKGKELTFRGLGA